MMTDSKDFSAHAQSRAYACAHEEHAESPLLKMAQAPAGFLLPLLPFSAILRACRMVHNAYDQRLTEDTICQIYQNT